MAIITYAEALRQALCLEMERDERVYLIGEDIGVLGNVFGVTKGLLERFGPRRVKSSPISEAAIVGAAVGSAMLGLRPVVEIMYIDFTTLAMDQIVNQMAKMRYMSGGKVKVPVVLRTQGGGWFWRSSPTFTVAGGYFRPHSRIESCYACNSLRCQGPFNLCN